MDSPCLILLSCSITLLAGSLIYAGFVIATNLNALAQIWENSLEKDND